MISGGILAHLIAADLVGVAACFFFDAFVSERRTSAALYYAIWFVLGVFCGLLIYLTCGNVTSPEKRGLMSWEDQGQTGRLVILTTTVILVALSILFYRLQWQYPRAADVYVPDNESLTLTFFISILAMVIFIHRTLAPDAKTASRKAKKR